MNWIVLTALNALYEKGEVPQKSTLNSNGEFIFLKNSLQLIEFKGKKIFAESGFKEHYIHFYKDAYQEYLKFLGDFNLVKPQTRYEESDIKILMDILRLRKDGTLDFLREQILKANESMRGLSQMFFKNDKYLENKPSIINALKLILDVEVFSNEKDQQYMYKLEVKNPKMIVLCENIDFLTKPNRPREYGIELWYAGGKNVAKLEFSETRSLPIYYSCDWDYDGIFIIYPLVRKHIPEITLLTPKGRPRSIKETEHKSLWKKGLEENNTLSLDETQSSILTKLIENDQWIIEESNDLIAVLGIEST